MNIPVIVVSGGPCGGKSTFLVHVREWLESYGLYPLIVSETATEFITAGVTPKVLHHVSFQEQLFLYSIDRESRYLDIAEKIEGRQVVVLCDRGLLDPAAYMAPKEYAGMITKLGYTKGDLMSRYKLVIHLVTAADGAEDFYTLSNNIARGESPEEARLLDKKTQHAWLGHPHQVIVDNSTDFATKMKRALRSLARTLNMPEPTEIERKFLVRNFTRDLIPPEAVMTSITQDYLTCEEPGERRLRKRVLDSETRFYYTEKLPTTLCGTRIEREREISGEEYQTLMQERDPRLQTVKKTRYTFPFSGKLLELDVLKGKHSGLVLLEVELQHIDDPITLPEGWSVTEVTDNLQYKNRTLAE